MKYLDYFIVLLQLVVALKGIGIGIILYHRRLELKDILDIRPFGNDRLKLREIAEKKKSLIKILLYILMYVYSVLVSLMIILALFAVIYNWLGRFE